MRETMRMCRLFVRKEQWLDNYALYMACKKHFGMKAWSEWEDKDIRMHRPEAVEKYRPGSAGGYGTLYLHPVSLF